jgi:hypothetical protein
LAGAEPGEPALIGAVAADCARAVPYLFTAVTWLRSVEPASPAWAI